MSAGRVKGSCWFIPSSQRLANYIHMRKCSNKTR